MYEWSEELQCLVDYMGIPVSRSEAKAVLDAAQAHLQKSSVQLAALAKTVLVKRYPEMVEQQDLTPKRFS